MAYWFKNRYSSNSILSTKIKKSLFKGKSNYQKIEIIDSYDFGRMLVLDGIVNVSEKDEFIYHEMMVHTPLFTHPNPRTILVLGGGDGGIVRELSKHPQVKKIDLVEIDPMVVDTSKTYLPFVAVGFKDSRLTVHVEDASRFVRNKRNIYDVIVVDSPDPIGAGRRLFHNQFYLNCFRALKEDGLLTAQSETPTFKHDLRIMRSMYKKLNGIFPIVNTFTACLPSYTPGIWCFAFCSKRYNPLKDFQKNKYEKFNFKTRYYNEAIHQASFALPNFLQNEI